MLSDHNIYLAKYIMHYMQYALFCVNHTSIAYHMVNDSLLKLAEFVSKGDLFVIGIRSGFCNH